MSKYMGSLLLVQNSVGCAAGVCSVNQVVPSIDSSGKMAGRRTSVLVIFEERVHQRDQDCEIETVFIRSKVCVEEHTSELSVNCPQQGWLGGASMGAVFQVVSGQSSRRVVREAAGAAHPGAYLPPTSVSLMLWLMLPYAGTAQASTC